MVDEATPEVPMEHEPKVEGAADMSQKEDSANGRSKRARQEDEETEENEERTANEPKLDSSEDADGKEPDRATIGSKTFGSSVEIFDYFNKLLRAWPPNLNVNKYEHIMLLELLKKGHLEAEKKIGKGIKSFQVRYHPQFKSRCFFLIREDESVDDFSFRKCLDRIMPLPESMQIKHDVNKALRGKGGGRGGGRGRGRGGR